MPFEIQSEASDIVTYGFSLGAGRRLLALWRDNVAQDEDPGTPVVLRLLGCAGQLATVIDVLHGLEQPLVGATDGTDLVIGGLLVKDYPLLICLSPQHRVSLPTVLKGY